LFDLVAVWPFIDPLFCGASFLVAYIEFWLVFWLSFEASSRVFFLLLLVVAVGNQILLVVVDSSAETWRRRRRICSHGG
jgi:hypothetical protein